MMAYRTTHGIDCRDPQPGECPCGAVSPRGAGLVTETAQAQAGSQLGDQGCNIGMLSPDPANKCEHEWDVAPGDWDGGEDRTYVQCKKCGVPGERTESAGEIYWPAT